jgi:signal transduction histidine kinase
MSIVAMVVLISLAMMLIAKTKLELSITSSVISIGMSYAFNMLAFLVSVVIYYYFLRDNTDEITGELFASLFTFFFEAILVIIPFRFRRLKNGFTFLNKKGAGSLGVFISIILLCCAILLSQPTEDNLVKSASVAVICICAIGIIIFWRRGITKSYLEYLQTQQLENLNTQISERDEQINELIKHNDYLAEIIHKDNKLIPTMELAVSEFLLLAGQDTDISSKGASLLTQLHNETAERSGLISTYQINNKKLPQTKIFEIDNLLRYMQSRAAEEDIMFDVLVNCDMKFMVSELIEQTKLQTLLADLLENAIIATQNCNYKSILVTFCAAGDFFEINVEDSGTDFQIDTLQKLGFERTTTHADSGGSGIGLISTFKIVKKHKASLIINEYKKKRRSFTKKITIRFDNEDKYRVNSYRADVIQNYLQSNA